MPWGKLRGMAFVALACIVVACGSSGDGGAREQATPSSAATSQPSPTSSSAATNPSDATATSAVENPTGTTLSPSPTTLDPTPSADDPADPTPTTPIASWGNSEIYVVGADGTGDVNLTNDISSDWQPVWSPDGTRIAFAKTHANQRGHAFYAMNADGSGVTEILPVSPGGYWGVHWLPDGRIGYGTWHGGNDGGGLYIADEGGANEIKVPMPGSYEFVAWSPDASRIAYISRDGGNSDLYVVNTDGSGSRNLSNVPTEENMPAWSPDGREIVYSSWDTSTNVVGLYIVDVESGQQRLLFTHPDGVSFPDWSPDGQRIAFVMGRTEETDIWVVDVDGTNPRQLTSAPHGDHNPAWSPDGATIAFVSDRDGGQPIECSFSAMGLLATIDSLEALTWQVHAIAAGTVIEQLPPAFGQPQNLEIEDRWPIYTDYILQVERQFRGLPAETLRLRNSGGTISDCTQTYEPQVNLVAGVRYLLFLFQAVPDDSLPDAYQPSVIGIWKVRDDETITSAGIGAHFNPEGYDGKTLDEMETLILATLRGEPPEGSWQPVPLEEAPITSGH